MKDYSRDKSSGILFFRNEEKERELLRRRKIDFELASLKKEINNLKEMISKLIAERN